MLDTNAPVSRAARAMTGLAPGSYVIRVVQPHGFKATVPANGALNLTLTSGETLTGKDVVVDVVSPAEPGR